MFSMQRRVALVTGAGPNIGREIALTLARAEATAEAVRGIGQATQRGRKTNPPHEMGPYQRDLV